MSGKEDLEKLPPKRLIHDFIIIMTENIIKCMHTITITELRLTVYMWTIAVRYIVYVAAYGHRCVWVNMYTVRYSLLWVMTYNLKTQLHTNQFEPSARLCMTGHTRLTAFITQLATGILELEQHT